MTTRARSALRMNSMGRIARALAARPSWLAAPLFLSLVALFAGCGGSPAGSGVAAAGDTPTPVGLAAPRPRSYAALGASETYGVGANPVTKSYAYRVAKSLGARHFADVGIPGATLAAAYDTELTNALTIRPALCTVFFGVNDIRALVPRTAFLQNLHDLVITLRRAGARVLIIGIPDLTVVPAVAAAHLARLHRLVTAWNAGMRKIAKETGSRFLDLTPYSVELARHRGYIAADGLHPSNEGHARLAQIVVATVRHDRLWRNL